MLTATQQRIAVRYGSQVVCLIARCPFDLSHIKSTLYSASDFEVDGNTYRMSTTPKGIELRGQEASWKSAPALMLRWPDLTRHINGLPESLRQTARRRDRLVHSTFPETAPKGRYDAARFEWWSERQRRVGLLRGDVLRQAFPLAFAHEPTDLFELAGVSA